MGSFKIKLAVWFVLLALLPLAVAFYGFGTLSRQSQTSRADSSLENGLRSAVAGYGARLAAAEARARALAGSRRLQSAFRLHDSGRAARLLPRRPDGPAAAETVTVADGRRTIGRVTVWVPIDGALVRSLGRGLAGEDPLVALLDGRVVAGPHAGARLPLVPGRPARVRLAGSAVRALASAPVGNPAGLELATFVRQSAIDAASSTSRRRILLALLGALALFGAATYLLGRSVVQTLRRLATAADTIAHGSLGARVDVRGNDEFALLGNAFNQMATQLEQRVAEVDTERTRVREAVVRFGAVLSATHDPDQLVRVVVESAVGAVGAAGGVVLGPGGELARAGDPDVGAHRLTLPLATGTSEFGSLVLSGDAFGRELVETASSLAAQVSVALENAQLHRLVEQQALVDPLTGLANRRLLEETLRTELARAARFGDEVCLVLADLDDFKQVNDRFGHAAGDEVLKAFAGALDHTVRDSDMAGRWGGEEFALVLPGTDAEGGARLADRARRAIGSTSVEIPGGSVRVTASFGVASFPGVHDRDALLAAADGALYAAKRAGKDRVAVAGDIHG